MLLAECDHLRVLHLCHFVLRQILCCDDERKKLFVVMMMVICAKVCCGFCMDAVVFGGDGLHSHFVFVYDRKVWMMVVALVVGEGCEWLMRIERLDESESEDALLGLVVLMDGNNCCVDSDLFVVVVAVVFVVHDIMIWALF